ncbi:spore germination protein [Bacillus swezeyi]|nr:spore germination protein [Bacillus swezeyi]MEC1261931.1 spore germination protein [Bacillus swezeyi]MED2930320.1 spore germination protein [Bacillus swezeyi]MED2944465.1 spore germination protein [Bacillus swezeyi]MED2966231.1 spore germination protein [Bacillus swezeyi]MED2976778.1 spore germination protein [Bacillus swezeyi]
MVISQQDKITVSQTVIIVTNFLLGTGILILPRTSVEAVKTPDVWLSVIFGGLVAIMAGFIMVELSREYPGKTFYQYSRDIIGKWMGGVISLLFICYFLATSGFQVRSVTEVIQFFLLGETPIWATAMIFLWCGIYLLVGGINPLARLYEIVFPITVLIFLTVVFMSAGIFDVDNLRPVLGKGITPAIQGIKTTTLAYTGIEVVMIIIPFMKKPDKAFKAALIGVCFSVIFYAITVIMVIGALSIDGVSTRTWPTLDLMRSFELPGLIFERFESLLLVIWIMQLFANFTISCYVAALGLSQLFKINIQPLLYILLPVVYLIAMTPKNINHLFQLGDLIGDSAIYLFGLTPLVLLAISNVRRKKT